MAEYQIEDTLYKSDKPDQIGQISQHENQPRWPLSRWVEGSSWSDVLKVSWSLSDQEAGHPAVELRGEIQSS